MTVIASVTSSAREAGEPAALVAGYAALAAAGLGGPLSVGAVAVVGAVAAAASVGASAASTASAPTPRDPARADLARRRLASAVQAAALVGLAGATGWGPALAALPAVLVAEAVRRHGPGEAWPTFAVAGAVGAMQGAIVAGWLPTVLPPLLAHPLAALGVSGLALTTARVARMASQTQQALAVSSSCASAPPGWCATAAT